MSHQHHFSPRSVCPHHNIEERSVRPTWRHLTRARTQHMVQRSSVIMVMCMFFSIPSFAQLDLSASLQHSSIALGNHTVITYTLTNQGASLETDVAFSTTLPASVTIAAVPLAETSCPERYSISAFSGSSTLTVNGAGMGPGESCTFSTLIQGSTAGVHTITSSQVTANSGNYAAASVDLTVDGSRTRSSISFFPTQIGVGQSSVMTISLDNSANGSFSFLSLFYSLPSPLEASFPAQFSSSCSGITLTGNVLGGSTIMGSGDTCSISFRVTSTEAGFFAPQLNLSDSSNNTLGIALASITADIPFLNPIVLNNGVNAGDTTTVQYIVSNTERDLEITDLTFSVDPNAALTGLAVETLPENGFCGTSSTVSDTGIMTVAGVSVSPGSPCVFEVVYRLPANAASGAYTMTSSTVNFDLGGSPTTSGAAATTLLVAGAPSITMSLTENTFVPGDTVTLNVIVNNVNASSASEIQFNLSYPEGFTLQSLPSFGSCGGTFISSNQPDDNVVAHSNGSLVSGDSCTLEYVFQSALGTPPGQYEFAVRDAQALVAAETLQIQSTSASSEVLDTPQLSHSVEQYYVEAGDSITLEYTISGQGTDISFTQDLQTIIPGATVVTGPQNDICGPGSALSGTDSLTFTGGSIDEPEGVCQFSVDVSIPSDAPPGNYVSTTSDLSSTVNAQAVTSASASTEFSVLGLFISESFIEEAVIPEGSLQIEYTIENHFSLPATGVVASIQATSAISNLVVDSFPSDPCGAGSSISGTSFLILSNGTIEANDTCTFVVDVTVPSGTAEGYYGSIAQVTSVSAAVDGNLEAGVALRDDRVYIGQQLWISKTFDRTNTWEGEHVTLTYEIANGSASDSVTALTFTDDFESALSGLIALDTPIADVCGTGSTLSGTDILSLTDGILAAGEICTFSIDLLIPGGLSQTTTVTSVSSTLSGDLNGAVIESDPAEAEIVVQPVALEFSQSIADSVVAGNEVDITLSISELGGQTLDAFQFSLDLEETLAGLVATNLPTDPPCGADSVLSGSSLLTLTNGSLEASDSCTFSIRVQVPTDSAPGDYINATSDLTINGQMFAGPATDTLTVLPFPPTVSASVDPAIFSQGLSGALVFEFDNSESGANATGLTWSGTLPEHIVAATPTNVSTTCAAGDLAATPGSDALSLTGASVGPGEVCTIQVDIASTEAGEFTFSPNPLLSSTGESPIGDVSFTVVPVPTAAVTFLPPEIGLAQTSTMTVALDNGGSILAANDLSFSHTLPAQLEITDPSVTTNSCGGTLVADAQGTTISLSAGQIAAESSCSITVQIAALDVGSYTHAFTPISSSLGTIPMADATLVVEGSPLVDAAFSPDVMGLEQTSTLTITVDHSAWTVAASNLGLSYTLPAGLEVAAAPNADSTCGAGILTADGGSTEVTFTGGSISGGETCTVSVNIAATSIGSYTVTTSETTSTSGTRAAASASLDVLLLPTLSAAFAPNEIVEFETSVYTVTVNNSSSDDAFSDLSFSGQLPNGLEVSSNASPSTTCSAGTLTATPGVSDFTFTDGSVSAQSSCDISFTVEATSGGAYEVTTSGLVTALGQSNAATASLNVGATPDVSASFLPALIGQAQSSTLTFTIDQSASGLGASAVNFAHTLPAMVIVADPLVTTNTCGGSLAAQAQDSSFSYTGGVVNAGETCTVSVDIVASAPGTYVSQFSPVNSSLGASTVEDSTLTVEGPPTLAAVFAPALIGPDQISTLTVTVNHANWTLSADDLGLTVSLPAGLLVAATPNASSSCAGGSLTANAGDATMSYTGGSVAAGATCTIAVDVVSTMAGVFTVDTGDASSTSGTSTAATAALEVLPIPTLSAAFSADEIAVSQNATLTLTMNNETGNADVSGLGFTGQLPDGLVFGTMDSGSTTCPEGSISAAAGETSFSFSEGLVTALSSCSVNLSVRAEASGSFDVSTSALTTPVGDSNAASANLTVGVPPTVSLSVSETPTSIGATVDLTITIDLADSLVDHSGLAFNLELPSGLNLASPHETTTDCDGTLEGVEDGGQAVGLGNATLEAGESCTVNTSLQASEAGTYAIELSNVTGSMGESATAQTQLDVAQPLAFFARFDPITIEGEETSFLRFSIENASPVDAVDIVFSADFPAGLVVASPENTSNSCEGTLSAAAGSGQVELTNGELAANDECTIAIEVASSVTEGSFTISTSDLTSSLGTSGTAEATLYMVTEPTAVLTFDTESMARGETAIATISLSNEGSTLDAANLALSGAFPQGLSLQGPDSIETDCPDDIKRAFSLAYGLELYHEDENGFTLEGGILRAGTGCEVSFGINGTAAGDYTVAIDAFTSTRGGKVGEPAQIAVTDTPVEGGTGCGCESVTGQPSDQGADALLFGLLPLFLGLLRRRQPAQPASREENQL